MGFMMSQISQTECMQTSERQFTDPTAPEICRLNKTMPITNAHHTNILIPCGHR